MSAFQPSRLLLPISLDRLQKLRDHRIEKSFQGGPRPATLIGDRFAGLIFSVSQDLDGHTEAYLSRESGNHSPGTGSCLAFFRHWGVHPQSELPASAFTYPFVRGWLVSPALAAQAVQPTL